MNASLAFQDPMVVEWKLAVCFIVIIWISVFYTTRTRLACCLEDQVERCMR